MSRLFKWLILLLGLAVFVLSILSLALRSQPALSHALKLTSQGLLVLEFLLIALAMMPHKRLRKNAIVLLICALVFAFTTVQTYLAHP